MAAWNFTSENKGMVNMRTHLKTFVVASTFAAVLAFAFFSYLRPEFVLDLANRIVLCF